MKYQNLPLYNAILGDANDGVYSVSLVEYPATEIDFVTFAKGSKKQSFSISNEDKHLLCSVVMLCNVPIYRRDGDFEYYIQYDAETLRKMAEKMMSDGTMNNFDLFHDGALLPKGAITIQEIYIKDEAKGINPNFIEGVTDGSIMATYKINDEALWQMCKDGTFKGISLSGWFTVKPTEEFKKHNKLSYKMLKKIKEKLASLLMEYGEVKTDNGTLNYEGDVIEVGTEVTNDDGEPMADGEYKAEDGTIYTIKDGKVEGIKEPETEEPEEKPEDMEDETPEDETPEDETPEDETTDPAPEEEPQPNEIEGLKAEIQALKDAIDAIKTQVAEIIAKPAEEPIPEQFEAVTVSNVKGYEKLKAMTEGIKQAFNK